VGKGVFREVEEGMNVGVEGVKPLIPILSVSESSCGCY
jgi:hypothetical protein